jgi:hypothetical protein
LDIKQSPYSGSLTLMGADPGFQSAVNRFYDLNEDPNEDQIIPMWRSSDNTGWVVNLLTGEGREIYRPTTPRPPDAGAGPWKNTGGQKQDAAPAKAVKPERPKKVEEPKEPEVPIEQLMARDPSSLTGPETARVMKNMTGPDFIRWLSGGGK